MMTSLQSARLLPALGHATLLRLAAGVVVAIVAVSALDPAWNLHLASLAIVLLGLGAASVVRGLELRAWFGAGLSLHQSQSLQSVLVSTRLLSRLQDGRRFEV
jgi:hypothetical protein